MDLGLAGKHAMVTGAGRGIGAAIAGALGREGCNVTLVDRDTAGLRSVAAGLDAMDRQAWIAEADVSDFVETERVIERAVREGDGLDILVLNAGITRDRVVWKMSEAEWDDVMNVNLKGFFNYIHAAAPIFRAQASGKIVTIASINGLRGKFGQSNYAAAKAGGIALTRSVARELGRFNVNVNAVAPGMVLTEMAASTPPEAVEKAKAETVLDRLATTEDVADAVVFLCSDRSRHVTGTVLQVDGGQYI